jgi:hypothetical protein
MVLKAIKVLLVSQVLMANQDKMDHRVTLGLLVVKVILVVMVLMDLSKNCFIITDNYNHS